MATRSLKVTFPITLCSDWRYYITSRSALDKYKETRSKLQALWGIRSSSTDLVQNRFTITTNIVYLNWCFHDQVTNLLWIRFSKINFNNRCSCSRLICVSDRVWTDTFAVDGRVMRASVCTERAYGDGLFFSTFQLKQCKMVQCNYH